MRYSDVKFVSETGCMAPAVTGAVTADQLTEVSRLGLNYPMQKVLRLTNS